VLLIRNMQKDRKPVLRPKSRQINARLKIGTFRCAECLKAMSKPITANGTSRFRGQPARSVPRWTDTGVFSDCSGQWSMRCQPLTEKLQKSEATVRVSQRHRELRERDEEVSVLLRHHARINHTDRGSCFAAEAN
jgi:hypothetical protein